jgi:hypothetical protein
MKLDQKPDPNNQKVTFKIWILNSEYQKSTLISFWSLTFKKPNQNSCLFEFNKLIFDKILTKNRIWAAKKWILKYEFLSKINTYKLPILALTFLAAELETLWLLLEFQQERHLCTQHWILKLRSKRIQTGVSLSRKGW